MMVTIIEKKEINEVYIKYDNIFFFKYMLSSYLCLMIILFFLVRILSVFTVLKIEGENKFVIFMFLVYLIFSIFSNTFYPRKDIVFKEEYVKINNQKILYDSIDKVAIKKIRRGRGESEYILVMTIKGKEKKIIKYGFLKDLEKILEVYIKYEKRFKNK